ncbi:hypothetical protein GSH08_27955 [Burkholderia pseudomallei]|nr:hypothetical protein [Burkholderia pseudomallei]MBM5584631.1 hypothetical protein [Burkholderia pseudomallei]RPA00243.1 hypothetical protein EGT86_26090 [Burkholderia pseudomallei]
MIVRRSRRRLRGWRRTRIHAAGASYVTRRADECAQDGQSTHDLYERQRDRPRFGHLAADPQRAAAGSFPALARAGEIRDRRDGAARRRG